MKSLEKRPPPKIYTGHGTERIFNYVRYINTPLFYSQAKYAKLLYLVCEIFFKHNMLCILLCIH